MTRGRIRSQAAYLLWLIAGAGVLMTLFPSTASAIPAWSRKYGVACTTCHYPAPPRLNIYGQKFRRAQYRTVEEFNKDVDWKSLGNYISMRIRAGYSNDSPEKTFPGSTGVKSGFSLNDATLFFAGPVTKHFSGFVELERPGNEEIIEAVVSIGGIRGTPDSFWTFRLGQFHTLARVGFGGLDRPTGISTPLALSRALVGSNAFKLNQDQVGVEGTYVNKNHRIIGQILNGSNLSHTPSGGSLVSETTDQADQNRDKDYLLAYELLWGKTASGLSVFGYDGRQDDLTSTAAPDIVKMKRYGVTASEVFKNGFEIQGGYVMGKDDYAVPVVVGVDSRDGRGYWGQVEWYLEKAKDLTLFARYDSVDPDTDVSKNTRTQALIGFVLPLAEWHARLALELRDIKQEAVTGDTKDKQVAAELMLNF